MKPFRWTQIVRRVSAGLICLALAVSSGCGWRVSEWSDRPETTVWSDDGEQLAVVRYDFDLKLVHPESAMPQRSEEESTIYFASPAATHDLRPIAQSVSGQITDLHFMRSEGYILSRRIVRSEPGGVDASQVVFEKMMLDGKVEEVTRSVLDEIVGCTDDDGVELVESSVDEFVIPSPDGKTLAWVRAVVGCDEPSGTLQFLDAADVRPLGEPIELGASLESFIGGVLQVGWDAHGRLLVTRASGVTFSAWAFVPDHEPVYLVSIGWACFAPVTTSSWISLDGYGARMTRTGSLTLTTEPLGGVFGCQHIAN